MTSKCNNRRTVDVSGHSVELDADLPLPFREWSDEHTLAPAVRWLVLGKSLDASLPSFLFLSEFSCPLLHFLFPSLASFTLAGGSRGSMARRNRAASSTHDFTAAIAVTRPGGCPLGVRNTLVTVNYFLLVDLSFC